MWDERYVPNPDGSITYHKRIIGTGTNRVAADCGNCSGSQLADQTQNRTDKFNLPVEYADEARKQFLSSPYSGDIASAHK
jgi:hypothetical protein